MLLWFMAVQPLHCFSRFWCGWQEMIEVHKGREDKQAKAQATARANSLVECQPNTGAPLLRDEKARRDWVERELDMCCQVGVPHSSAQRSLCHK